MSLGKDLATIRKSQHLTLEDIQNAIKIPVHTLQSIEDDSIFDKTDESRAYIRSFVRSYARYLKIDDQDIINALDAEEEGNYRGQLLAGNDEASDYDAGPEIEDDLDPARFNASYTPGNDSGRQDAADSTDAEQEDDDEAASGNTETGPVSTPSTSATTSTGTRKTGSSTDAKSKSSGPAGNIDWADMGKRFNPGSSDNRAWLIIVLIVLVASVGVGGYVYSDEIVSLFSSSENNELAENEENEQNPLPAPADSVINEDTQAMAAADSGTVNPEESLQNPVLGDTLTVAVYAAYGILDPVRVTSDFNWRTNPFWMEQGDAYNFDFRDSLLVRGQYSDLILLFNGHVIENPRQNHFSEEYNSILITRSVLNQPGYLAEPPATFPLDIAPPDTIVYRISF